MAEIQFGMTRIRVPAALRRSRILDAAVEAFAEHGFAEAKMQDIAKLAGVVPSVLYDHFGSKRELHVAVLQHHAAQLRERSLRPIESASPEEYVRASIANYFEFVESDPFMWRFLHRDPPADPATAAVIAEIGDRGTAAIADLIRVGARDLGSEGDGLSRDDSAWILARATQSACDGVAKWWYEHREVPCEQVVDMVFTLLWQGFGGVLRASN